jgi:hypothetical protein
MIGFGFMATHSALAAVLEGIIGHGVALDGGALVIPEQVKGLGWSMGIVAAGAGPRFPALDDAVFIRFHCPLDVKVVQVLVPIPEVGNTIFALTCNEGWVVALETQGELLRSEWARVSFHVVGGEKQLGLGGRVGSMTIGAIPICDGRMLQIVVLSEDLVALPAQRRLIAQEQGTVFRCVRSVAIGAASFRNRLVDHGTAINHAVVALLAQPFGRPW